MSRELIVRCYLTQCSIEELCLLGTHALRIYADAMAGFSGTSGVLKEIRRSSYLVYNEKLVKVAISRKIKSARIYTVYCQTKRYLDYCKSGPAFITF